MNEANERVCNDMIQVMVAPLIEDFSQEVKGLIENKEWVNVAYCFATAANMMESAFRVVEQALTGEEKFASNIETQARGQVFHPEFEKRAMRMARNNILAEMMSEIERVLGEEG